MACQRCEKLIFNFTEELGEFINVHIACLQQLDLEPDEDDLTEAGYHAVSTRMAQGMVVAELVKRLASAACDGHDDRGAFEQFDLFSTKPPLNS